MKLLKLADLTGQILMLVTGIVLFLLPGNRFSFLACYFLVGSWQMASLLIHYLVQPAWLNLKNRRLYSWFLVYTILAGLASLFLLLFEFPAILFFLGGLIFVAPVYAAWYFIIGVSEWQTITRRELVHLK